MYFEEVFLVFIDLEEFKPECLLLDDILMDVVVVVVVVVWVATVI